MTEIHEWRQSTKAEKRTRATGRSDKDAAAAAGAELRNASVARRVKKKNLSDYGGGAGAPARERGGQRRKRPIM